MRGTISSAIDVYPPHCIHTYPTALGSQSVQSTVQIYKYTNTQIHKLYEYTNTQIFPTLGPHLSNRTGITDCAQSKQIISVYKYVQISQGTNLDHLYIVQSVNNVQSTVCNTAKNNCKSARSQLCAMLQLQSLILSKHVMFDQQSSATSPNMPRTAFWQNTV